MTVTEPVITAPVPEGTDATEPYLDIRVSIPARCAATLKHATHSRLSLDEAASMVLQLYADAPLERGSRTLTAAQCAEIATCLGFSPQSADQMVAAIRELVRISIGGVRLDLSKEDIDIMHARNVLGLPPKEYAKQIWREMFEAWRNGRI